MTGRLLLFYIYVYWSLVWLLLSSQGFLEKSILEKSMQLQQATLASAWSLVIDFNGNQGGRLHRCHHNCVHVFYPDFLVFVLTFQ